MKIEFSHIEISNFLSYGNNTTTVKLQSDKPILILGKNYVASSDGSDSNGAGKSSILNAICFALYDDVLFKCNVDKLINNINKKDLLVTLFFSVDNVKYKIQRFRKNKALGGDGIKIFRNGNDKWEFSEQITPDSTSNANKLIVKIIGKSFEIFSRIVVFSATSKPFLSLTSPEQIEFLEELFGYSEVSDKADQIRENYKSTKQLFEKESAVNVAIKAEIQRKAEQLTQLNKLSTEWTVRHASTMSEVETQLYKMKDIDFRMHEQAFIHIQSLEDGNRDLSSQNEKIKQKLHNMELTRSKARNWESEQSQKIKNKEQELLKINSLDYDVLLAVAEELQELRAEKKIIESGVSRNTVILSDLKKKNNNISNEINSLSESKCPYCKQDYADAKCSHDKLVAEQAELLTKIQEMDATISEDVSIIAQYDNRINELTQGKQYSIIELSAMRQSSVMVEKEIETLKSQTNPHQVEDELFLEPEALTQNEEFIIENKESIQNIQNRLIIKNQYELSELKASLKHYERRYEELQKEQNPHIESILNITSTEMPEVKDAVLDEMDRLMKHQDFLIKLLTKKDSFVRKSLLQKNLPLLNTRLKIYLQKMGLPHKVTFLENMTTQIKQFDTEMDFNQLSSGQRARINLALSFAFRDVLQYRHGPVNFCMLDECLDTGLSNTGVQLAVKFIKEVATEQKLALFIISHRDEAASMFDNKLCIEYKNGFSNII
jgi:DNA repair exonuclease SbcCD ATPase subunit